MMLRKGMLARKQRTANLKSNRPKPAAAAAAKKKPENRHQSKTHKFVGVYRLGGANVSKQAMKSQGPKEITDALKGNMNTKKMRQGASSYDKQVLGFESGKGPKRAQTEAVIHGVRSGKTGQSLWSAHKNAAKSGY